MGMRRIIGRAMMAVPGGAEREIRTALGRWPGRRLPKGEMGRMPSTVGAMALK